jgi:hypothetical protein
LFPLRLGARGDEPGRTGMKTKSFKVSLEKRTHTRT